VDAGDPGELREELGDRLFQVFFITRLAEERGWFGIDAVADGITAR
jgi:NTP pyrophosphatase (non-canonical NTP hydrolase)